MEFYEKKYRDQYLRYLAGDLELPSYPKLSRPWPVIWPAYRMLMKGQDRVDRGAAYYEQRQQHDELIHLQRKAKLLGIPIGSCPITLENPKQS
jgi:hypothetical protein